MSKIKYTIVGVLFITVLLTTIQVATAYSSYQTAFNTKYSTSGTRLDSCGLCHVNPAGGGPRNPYGQAFGNQSMHASNATQAFINIEHLDSDGDGYTNLAEILARTFPGNASDHPLAAPVLTTITVTPSTVTLAVNGTQTFTAAAKDQYSHAFNTTITWSSNSTTVGTINSTTGKFTAHANGIAKITAKSGTVNGTATVTVLDLSSPVLTTITVTPSTATLTIGGTQAFTATTKDQYGNPINASVTWSSTNTTVGTVNSTGKFKALANGTTTIKATHGSISGSASVTVGTPAPIPSPAGTAQVTFIVINNQTGKPVHEAKVTLDGVTKETNRTGQVTFNNVSLGNHTYKVVPEDDDEDDDCGHHQVNGTINVTGNTVIQVQLTMNEGHAYGHEHNHGNHYGQLRHDLKHGHDHKDESRTTEDEDDDS
ncbi:MAG: Ig-like domain-containing protein [Thaumarchaeota archaeon]|nr:Ig-like domain-containing protein [Nitrososphaerota archaeon]MCL5319048.1 Ig-like domain-containing protein [Nitrososphaerota archaeon]